MASVDRGVPTPPARFGAAGLFNGCCKISGELLDHGSVPVADRKVQRVRRILAINVPTPGSKRIANGKGVDVSIP